MASTVTTESVSASEPSKLWTAGISLDFSSQHQSRVGSEGAEYVRGAAVKKVVEASPQGLAIDRHMTLTSAVRRVVQHGGMTTERSFDRGGIEFRKMPRIVV